MVDLAIELSAQERRAYAPRDQLSPCEWARRNLRLRGKSQGQSTSFDPNVTPYLVEVLNCIHDPLVEVVFCNMSTQVGKTTAELVFLGYTMDQDPGDVLLIMTDENSSKKMLETRVKPMIDMSPKLKRHRLPGAHNWRKEQVNLAQNTIFLGWAGSPASLASQPIPYILGDECAKWPLFSKDEGSPMKLAQERTRTFANSMQLFVSTPKFEYDLAWMGWLRGDQCLFYVPCPHCGHYQTLDFKNVRRKPGFEKVKDPERIRTEDLATYYCSGCGESIENKKKPSMLLKGKWVPDGFDIDDATGEIIGNPPPRTIRSFRVWCTYSPWLTWSKILAEWFDCQNAVQDLMNFKQGWLAEYWSERETEIKDERIDALIEQGYSRGEVPDGVRILLAGADVQWSGGDHSYYSVWGFGQHAERWLIDWGVVYRDEEESDLKKIGEIMTNNSYRRSDGIDMKVKLCGVDSGDGKRYYEVYDLSKVYPRTIVPCKGVETFTDNRPLKMSVLDRYDGKREFPGAVNLCLVNTDLMKSELLGKIKEPQAMGPVHLPSDVSNSFKRSLVSEVKETRRDTKGRPKQEWVVRQGYRNNHYLDTTVYCRAMSHMKVVDSRFNNDPQPGARRKRPTRDPRPTTDGEEKLSRRERRKRQKSWIDNSAGGIR